MKVRIIQVLMFAVFLFVLLGVKSTSIALEFPDPLSYIEVDGNMVPATVQFGDFYSYSLPLLEYVSGLDYTIASSPGKLKDFLVIGTGAVGHLDNNSKHFSELNMDNPYETSGPNSASFSTGTSDDPGGAGQFTGDTGGTWDIELDSLTAFLGGSDLLFFFNNNQQASNVTLDAWAQIALVDTTIDNPMDTLYFDFTNIHKSLIDPWLEDGVYDYDSSGPADNNYPSGDDYVTSGDPLQIGNSTLDHNLGSDAAAYAIFSPELNDLLSFITAGYDVMQIDIRLTGLNNGYEQIFIMGGHNVNGTIPPEPIPEPSTMLLLGVGLIGLGAFARKKFIRQS